MFFLTFGIVILVSLLPAQDDCVPRKGGRNYLVTPRSPVLEAARLQLQFDPASVGPSLPNSGREISSSDLGEPEGAGIISFDRYFVVPDLIGFSM